VLKGSLWEIHLMLAAYHMVWLQSAGVCKQNANMEPDLYS